MLLYKLLLLGTIKHIHRIDALRKATQFLNSGQTIVMAFDAPFFALSKFIKWKWPGPHGEHKFIENFMALHPFAASNFDTSHFQLLKCFTAIVYDNRVNFKNFIVKKRRQWRGFPRLDIPSCSIQSGLRTYQAGSHMVCI